MNKTKGGESIAEENKEWKPGETAFPKGMFNSEESAGRAEDERRKYRH